MNKLRLQHHFNQVYATYDAHSTLQQEAGMQLLNFIKDICPRFERIIDLGCGTGLTTMKVMHAIEHDEFHAIDIAPALLTTAQQHLQATDILMYQADFDNLPTYPQAFNLIYSNMALHWSADLPITLSRLAPVLASDGLFAFSIPLAGTLQELQLHFHHNHFYNAEEILQQLTHAGYAPIMHCRHYVTLTFPDTLSALRSLKKSGTNYVIQRKQHSLRGKKLLQINLHNLTYCLGYFLTRLI